MKNTFVAILLIMLFPCHGKERQTQKQSLEGGEILISNVNLVNVESGQILSNQFVLVKDERIETVTNVRPQGTFNLEIDGAGKYLMPGLINMYTHVNEDNLILYLANGQTTVKDAPSHLTALGLRERIKAKEIVGPRIFAVGLRATGMPTPYHSQQPVRTAEEAREQVREAKRLGYNGMFIYGSCDPNTYQAIMEEASRLNFHVSGHYPQEVSLKETLNRTQKSFDNLTGLTRGGQLLVNKDSLFQGMINNGQAVTPTLTVHRLWSVNDRKDSIYAAIPTEYVSNMMKATWGINNGSGTYPYEQVTGLIKEMYEKGIPVFIGSDGGFPLVVNGFSYHQELENLHEIGIPIPELIKMATTESARFLDFKDLGLIRRGYKADLLLLNDNPFLDLKNLKTIAYVVVNGQPVSRETLDKELASLKTRIENPGNRFESWSDVMEDWTENDSIVHYSFLKNGIEVGEEKIKVKILDNRNFSLESINIMDGPEKRETHTYIRVRNRTVDSMNLMSVTPEGVYTATVSASELTADITGTAPFHGDFSYSEPMYSGTLLLGPFSGRYFDLDIATNYLLAMLMKRSLNVGQADQLPVIQIELNSEEFGKKLIVDNSEFTLYRQAENLYKVIYHGYSGYRSITRPSFSLSLKVEEGNLPVWIREGPFEIKLKTQKAS